VARSTLIQTNFTAGEISPRVFGRTDLQRYANGAAELENVVVLVQGAATRRSGSYYAGAVKTAAERVRLVPFEVSTIATYTLEFGNLYVRFWRNRAPVLNAGVPVEVVTPYTTAQLRELRFTQSADVLFICHPNHPPQLLSRISETSWTLAAAPFQNGPWEDENTSTVTLTPSGSVGSITVTASAATFVAGDVGRLISLRDEVGQRVASTAYTAGQNFHAIYNQTTRLYQCVVAGTTAAADPTTTVEPAWDKNAPTGESNIVRDGTAVLKYLGRGKSLWGWGVITGFTSSTQVTVTVVETLPATSATVRWRLGAWGGARGAPRCMTFFQSRAVWCGSIGSPQTVWVSEAGSFFSMSPSEQDGSVLDTNAITLTLDDNEVNTIRWASNFGRGVLLGCPSGEFVIGPAQPNAAISPSNFRAERKGDRGSSAKVAGVRVGAATLFVSRSDRQVREFIYDFNNDAFRSGDQTVLAEHITGSGIVEAAYQRQPEGTLWAVREDGVLLSYTYDREQEVRAWQRHTIAGENAVVESVAVVASPDGTTDDVYISVARTIGGATVRYVEWIGAPFDAVRDGEFAGVFVDSALTYDGPPELVFTGLHHLEGEEVAICADGAKRPPQTVTSGFVRIEEPPASLVHVGLPYRHRIKTLRPELPLNSTAQGRAKRIIKTKVRLLESMGGEIGTPDGRFEALLYRTPLDDMTAAVPLFTGDIEIRHPAGFDDEGQIVIQGDDPLPMTVLAVIYEVQVND
jgi:hypothetical protein